MARPERSVAPSESFAPLPIEPPAPASSRVMADADYRLGGPVGQMQADLARQLGLATAGLPLATPPEERLLRRLSMAAGYGALAAGYAGAAFLLLR